MKLSSKHRITSLTVGVTLFAGGLIQAQATPQNSTAKLQAQTQVRVRSLLQAGAKRAGALHLTADQKTKMAAIARKNQPLVQAIWNDNSLSQSVKASKVRALENETQSLLTPAQKQQLTAAKNEAMSKLFTTAMWVSNELDLSGEQQLQLKDIVITTVNKTKSGNFGALRNLVIDTGGRVDKVLTPAQRAKWSVIKTTAQQELIRQTRNWRQMNHV